MNPGISRFYFKLSREGKAEYPVEAYNFVFDTILHVSRSDSFTANKPERDIHLSPKKICSLLNSRMQKEFGIYVNLVLKTWKVSSGTDIGNIVFALSDYNCLKLAGTETPEDFARAGLGEFK